MQSSVLLRQMWLATLLGIFTFFVLLSNLNQITNRLAMSEMTILSLLIIAISIYMLSRAIAIENIAFNSALFWLFNYIFFGLVTFIFSIDSQPYYLGTFSSENSLITSYIIISISTLLVAVTELTTKSRENKTVEQKKENQSIDSLKMIKNLKILNLLYLAYIFPALNYLGWTKYLFRSGWYSNFQTVENLSLHAITTTILIVVPIVITLFLLNLRVEGNVKVSNTWIAANVVWLIVLANPSAQSRQQTLFILVPFIFIVAQRWRILARFFLMLVPVVIIFFANLFSRYNGKFTFGKSTNVLSRSGDLDAFFQLSNGVELISQGNFTIFKQILGTVFFFLPRNVWNSKPFDTGVEIANLNGLEFQNLSAPWVLEAFVNARWFGVVAVSIIIGRFLARSRMNSNIEAQSTVVAGIISGSIFILLRGSLLQATGRVIFSIFLVYLLTFFSKKPVRY